MANDIVFGDGYQAGYKFQRMTGAGSLNSTARDLAPRVKEIGSWDTGFLLGSLIAYWREVDRGTEADRGTAGDSVPTE